MYYIECDSLDGKVTANNLILLIQNKQNELWNRTNFAIMRPSI